MKTREAISERRKIAEKHGITVMFVGLLIRGERNTTNHELATDIARITGKTPIEHITEPMRDLYARLYPELGKPVNGKK